LAVFRIRGLRRTGRLPARTERSGTALTTRRGGTECPTPPRRASAAYAAGHHAEAREAVIEAIQKLDSLYVALEPVRFGKKERLRDRDRVLNVQRYTLEEPSKRVHSIRYELGTWFERWKDDHVLANRKILELDAKREASAKILARYFVQRRGEAERSGRIVRRVRDLFAETATEIDRGKNPQRSRDWLEVTLRTLKKDHIIADWSYAESVDNLPRYKWLEPWLEYHVVVAFSECRLRW
jgi:hypothetical protein